MAGSRAANFMHAPDAALDTLQIPRVSLLVMICFHHASGRLISFATLFFQQLAGFIASFFPEPVLRNVRCLRKIDIINQIRTREVRIASLGTSERLTLK